MALKPCTAREETFVQTFAINRNVAHAYEAAFDCTGMTRRQIGAAGQSLLKTSHIEARLREVLNIGVEGTVEVLAKIQGLLWDIINADPNELVSLKVGCCRHCHGIGHAYQWRESEYLEVLAKVEAHNRNPGRKGDQLPPDCSGGLDFDETVSPNPDCPECNGAGVPRVVLKDTEHLTPGARALYGGVKQTAHGVQIIMADKMKAIEMLGRIHGGFNDNVKVSGVLQTLGRVVELTTTDPNEAAAIYQDMVAGRLTAPST